MDREGHAPHANMRRKTEDAIAHHSIFLNVEADNTVGKSVCLSVVDLTDDAWLIVFSYLGIADRTRIAGVCRRWRELTRITWRNITRLSFDCIFKHPLTFVGRGSHQLTDNILEFCLRQCGTHLRCLDFSTATSLNSRLTPRALDLVGRLCGTSLQELTFTHMDRTVTSDLTYTALKTLLEQRLPRLRSLSWTDCKYYNCRRDSEEKLRSTVKMPQSLMSLNVEYNECIDDEFFSQAPQSLTEVFAWNCKGLTDRGVCFLAERCPNLETIDITKCYVSTGQSITNLVENCPKLKSFKFGRYKLSWPKMTEGDLLTLPSNLPLLEELFVHGQRVAMTDEVFYELGRHCPLLRSIASPSCSLLTDAAIYNLSPCHHLETINLNECDQITDRGLIQLSLAHSQLKKVYLEYCHNITDEGVGCLLSNHPNLLELDIERCGNVTDRVLAAYTRIKLTTQGAHPATEDLGARYAYFN